MPQLQNHILNLVLHLPMQVYIQDVVLELKHRSLKAQVPCPLSLVLDSLGLVYYPQGSAVPGMTSICISHSIPMNSHSIHPIESHNIKFLTTLTILSSTSQKLHPFHGIPLLIQVINVAPKDHLNIPYICLPEVPYPFLQRENKWFSPGVDQFGLRRENRCPQYRARNYFLFGNYLRRGDSLQPLTTVGFLRSFLKVPFFWPSEHKSLQPKTGC